MKALLQSLVTKFLITAARCHLSRTKPIIIGITGSVGKTTTKEVIFHVLKNNFKAYRSEKSFNTPLGMALSILAIPYSGPSISSWIQILFNTFILPLQKNEILILEYGADKPGDIEELLTIAKPNIAVITAIRPVHMAEGQFENLEAIAAEKGKLLQALPENGLAIVNSDDFLVAAMKTSAPKILLGSQGDAKIGEIETTNNGISFSLSFEEKMEEIAAPLLGKVHAFPLSAAVLIASYLGINWGKSVKELADFTMPPGRMTILEGVNGSTLIDSSYNANPASMRAALEVLAEFPTTGRRIAALGTMNELGEISKKEHESLGQEAAKIADLICAVGPSATVIEAGVHQFRRDAVLDPSLGQNQTEVKSFEDSQKAGEYLRSIVQSGDVILLKGSQNRVRMELAVEKLLAHVEDRKKLCRQGKEWKR